MSADTITPIYANRENPNDEFVILTEWLVKDGTKVNAGQPIAIVETSKASIELPAPSAGYLRYNIAPSTQVPILGVLAYLCGSPGTKTPFESSETASTGSESGKFTAKARKLMRERGLTESDFASYAQVREKDILEFKSSPQPTSAATQTQAVSGSKAFEVRNLERAEANAFASSVCIPFDSRLIRAKWDAGFSIGELVMHAAAKTLERYKELNAYFESGKQHLYPQVGLGFAISIHKGLKVPVVVNASQLSLSDFSAKVRDLTLQYLRDELTAESFAGGTFTVTDLSSYGVTSFDPLINYRQGSILGICAQAPESPYFNLVLKFDHRLSDGATAASFLKDIESDLQEGEKR